MTLVPAPGFEVQTKVVNSIFTCNDAASNAVEVDVQKVRKSV